MPGKSGNDVAGLILEIHPEARVLYMSGHTNHGAVLAGAPDGRTPILPKPFTPDGLARAVRRILHGPAR